MRGPGWSKLEQVVCRQKNRSDERPLKYRHRGRWVEVERVLAARLERGPGEMDPTFRVFEVLSEGGVRLLRVAVDGWAWEIREVQSGLQQVPPAPVGSSCFCLSRSMPISRLVSPAGGVFQGREFPLQG